MPTFAHDGLNFYYRESGSGVPFVFQHGLGADIEQPFEAFPPPRGCRLIAFDCRYHGRTEPRGPVERVSVSTFAEDLGALLDHLQIDSAVLGGISMGAAVALRFACSRPDRLLGLVQVRPAWLVGPNHRNAAVFSSIAELLRTRGTILGRQEFAASALYQSIAEESADAADSLAGQFEKPFAVERAARLERIPKESVVDSLRDLSKIGVPTLVLANQMDPIHPYDFGKEVARSIPGAILEPITPKSISTEMHFRELRSHLTTFLRKHFL